MELDFIKLFSDDVFRYFIIGCIGFAIFIWAFNLITSNFSHMDRVWAILPNVYGWLFVFTNYYYNPSNSFQDKKYSIIKSDSSSQLRLLIMVLLMSIWGIRLTYVFYRRGYYSLTHEDHRWEFIKKKLNYPEKKLMFHLYNIILMACIQNWILIGHAIPLWYIQTNTANNLLKEQAPLNILDGVMIVLFLVFFLLEAVADEQQWKFQSRKYQWIAECKKTGDHNSTIFSKQEIEDFKRGFICKGLFAYSRHPNYLGEWGVWWCIYGFTISSQYPILKENFHFSLLFNYSMYSSVIMTFLFPRSSKITEKISSSKYPEYADYLAKVNQIIPSFTAYKPKKN